MPPQVLARGAQLSIQSQLKLFAARLRDHSHRLRDKFGKGNPHITAAVCLQVENIADEVEELGEGKI